MWIVAFPSLSRIPLIKHRTPKSPKLVTFQIVIILFTRNWSLLHSYYELFHHSPRVDFSKYWVMDLRKDISRPGMVLIDFKISQNSCLGEGH